jgi:hypothetical protein
MYCNVCTSSVPGRGGGSHTGLFPGTVRPAQGFQGAEPATQAKRCGTANVGQSRRHLTYALVGGSLLGSAQAMFKPVNVVLVHLVPSSFTWRRFRLATGTTNGISEMDRFSDFF